MNKSKTWVKRAWPRKTAHFAFKTGYLLKRKAIVIEAMIEQAMKKFFD